MDRRVKRADRGTLAPAQRLANGWLRVEGRSARTGILEYDNPDGSVRRELVLPDDLFDEKSLDSARMVPVVNTHPVTGLIDSQTARYHQVGSVGENLRADAEYLVAPLMITDAAAVQAVESGRQELSWGYDCGIDPPDPKLVAKWGEHDGIQRGRIYNHLAIVDKARAGDGARIRLDADGNAKQEFAINAALQHSNAAAQQNELEPTQMPTQIRIDNLTVNSDAPDLQSVIDRAVAQIRTDSDKATKAEKERADALTASLKHVKANAISRGTIVRSLTAKLDAMKAKMIGCDECGGSGKVDAGEGAELAKCDYCDGVGSLRMHDAIKAAPVANDAEEENLEMDDAEEPEMVDDASLERDDPEEEKVEKVANPEHKDAKKRADARKAAQKRRADSIVRMVNRAAKARAALLTEATSHLGADAKLDGKGNEEIEREVVAKLAPHVKLDGLSAREVGVLFASETGRVAKARKDGQMSASDIARAGLMPVPMMTANRADADLQKKIDAANHAKYHSHEPKSAK